jgi:oligoribonuclease NrnB/cAMP/cGMP phosphodiesterase (DHH superfamily)
MREKVLCIYHNADLDGICSAAIVYNYFYDVEDASIDGNVILYGMNYGDDFPWSFVDENEMPEEDCVPYDKVVMVDFSLPQEDMKRLNNLVDLIWIDHHASVIDDNKDIQGIRDVNYAACELTYMYFNTSLTYLDGQLISCGDIPLAIKLLGRYDVWDHSDRRVIPFQYGMRLYDIGPYNSEWSDLLEPNNITNSMVQQIIDNGEIIEKYQSNLNYKYTEKYGFIADLEFEDKLYKVLCINRGFCNSSVVKDSILYNDSIDIVMCFVRYGEKYRVSLYTEKDVDVSLIAESFGGGGHKKASGFTCTELLFEEYGGSLFIEIGPNE